MINNWDSKTVNFLENNCFRNKNIVRFTLAEQYLLNELKSKKRKIFDYGCGTGRLLELINQENVKYQTYFGFDTSESMLDVAKSKFKDNNFSNLSIDFSYFTVICIDVLQHQENPFNFISNILSENPSELYLIFWVSENGKNLDDKNNIITLDSTNTKFIENIYSHNAVNSLMNLLKEKFQDCVFETKIFNNDTYSDCVLSIKQKEKVKMKK